MKNKKHLSHQKETLKKTDLIELLNTMTLNQMADKFNTSIFTIQKAVSKQFAIKTIGFTVIEPDEVVIDKSIGAWEELKNTQLYKQVMGK